MSVDGYAFDQDAGLWVAYDFAGARAGDTVADQVLSVIATAGGGGGSAVGPGGVVHEPAALVESSHQRVNLLEAVSELIDPAWRVLELGGGSGALTTWLASRVRSVDVLEPSWARAAAARMRLRDDDAVTFYVGDPVTSPVPGAYDLVVLAPTLGETWRPGSADLPGTFAALLSRARACLTDDGVLLLATDNRLGVRYLAGCADDHTSRVFDGPLRYPGGGVAGFGRRELARTLGKAGFPAQQFYHLHPDHFLPTTVVREVDDLRGVSPHQWAVSLAPGRQAGRDYVMHDALLLRGVEDAGLLWECMNAFLVLCSPSPAARLSSDWLIRKLANSARPELHHTVTLREVAGKLRVERVPLGSGRGVMELDGVEHRLHDDDFVAGSLLAVEALEALVTVDWEQRLGDICAELLDAARARFPLGEPPADGGPELLGGGALDFTLWNVVRGEDGALHPIDRKWRALEPIAADYVLFRSLFYVLSTASPFLTTGVREAAILLLRRSFPGAGQARFEALLEEETRLQRLVHADDPAQLAVDESGTLRVPAIGSSVLLRLEELTAALALSRHDAEVAARQHDSDMAAAESHHALERAAADAAHRRQVDDAASQHRREVEHLDAELTELRAKLAAMYASTSWRASRPIRVVGDGLVRFRHSPRGQRLRREAGRLARRFAPGLVAHVRQRPPVARVVAPSDPLLLAAEARRLGYRPLVSVLVPVYNTAPEYLRLAVRSVLDQAYDEWELCLCDDGSTDGDTLAALEELATLHPRIRVRTLERNSGIATATNEALAMATGEFVAMLDHDDELDPAALLEVVKVLNGDPLLDVVYTDQDYVEADGSLARPFHKPDWSLEMFRGVMYVGHLLVVRRELAERVHGFDPAFDNVQDFEFMLRLAEVTERIGHVPEILYHWRRIPGSVAFQGDEKQDIEPRQAAAVNAHLRRCGVPAVASSNPAHAHRLLIAPADRPERPVASVIVRASGAEASVDRCVDTLLTGSTYANCEVIVTGGALTSATAQRLRGRGVLITAAGADAAAAVAAGFAAASGALLVSLRADLVVETPQWLEHFLLDCELPGVACVTPVVLAPDGLVASAGWVLDEELITVPAMAGWVPESDGHAGSLSCVREVTTVAGDCWAVTRRVLDELGGLDPYLASSDAQVTDLSLRAVSHGCRNLCTPRVVVRRLTPVPAEADDLDALLLHDAWEPLLRRGDPFWPSGNARTFAGQ